LARRYRCEETTSTKLTVRRIAKNKTGMHGHQKSRSESGSIAGLDARTRVTRRRWEVREVSRRGKVFKSIGSLVFEGNIEERRDGSMGPGAIHRESLPWTCRNLNYDLSGRARRHGLRN
jgi:hypothetical protein